MDTKKTILIVDDSKINRSILAKTLSDTYNTEQAADGSLALDVLNDESKDISVIILDLMMPVMDGFEFMRIINKNPKLKSIPVIVTTAASDNGCEVSALECGAWDFVFKPYNEKVLKFRIKNVLLRSEMSAYQQLKYLSEYDSLTGLYNKEMFFKNSENMFYKHLNSDFALIRFDIDRFKLINSFFGMDEGDKLLKYIADKLREYLGSESKGVTYSRIESDVFAICTEYSDKEKLIEKIRFLKDAIIDNYELEFNINLNFGIYLITNIRMPMNVMLDKAALAEREIKGSHINNYNFYTDEIGEKLERIQQITNEMNSALKNKEFVVYYQPKYSAKTNKPCGAEALVRWLHPKKGLVSPGIFIPVFERNGFISHLDHYVWESVCKTISAWLKSGISPYPVSINISRVNLYDPNLVNILCEFTDKYSVPRNLLQLELTESLYTENPKEIVKIIDMMHAEGFTVLMDDFGSGYSSLNILKDLDIDILKIDMAFFSKSNISGRAENIIAAIIRMSKWLGLKTTAEGVEDGNQAAFLREIGCNYIQGYYFAKPMPLEDYNIIVRENETVEIENEEIFNLNSIWTYSPQMQFLFSDSDIPTGIYEVLKNNIQILRSNDAYLKMFGDGKVERSSLDPLSPVCQDNISEIYNIIGKKIISEKSSAEFVYNRENDTDSLKWVKVRMRHIADIEDKVIMICTFEDFTFQKETQKELEMLRAKAALSDAAEVQ